MINYIILILAGFLSLYTKNYKILKICIILLVYSILNNSNELLTLVEMDASKNFVELKTCNSNKMEKQCILKQGDLVSLKCTRDISESDSSKTDVDKLSNNYNQCNTYNSALTEIGTHKLCINAIKNLHRLRDNVAYSKYLPLLKCDSFDNIAGYALSTPDIASINNDENPKMYELQKDGQYFTVNANVKIQCLVLFNNITVYIYDNHNLTGNIEKYVGHYSSNKNYFNFKEIKNITMNIKSIKVISSDKINYMLSPNMNYIYNREMKPIKKTKSEYIEHPKFNSRDYCINKCTKDNNCKFLITNTNTSEKDSSTIDKCYHNKSSPDYEMRFMKHDSENTKDLFMEDSKYDLLQKIPDNYEVFKNAKIDDSKKDLNTLVIMPTTMNSLKDSNENSLDNLWGLNKNDTNIQYSFDTVHTLSDCLDNCTFINDNTSQKCNGVEYNTSKDEYGKCKLLTNNWNSTKDIKNSANHNLFIRKYADQNLSKLDIDNNNLYELSEQNWLKNIIFKAVSIGSEENLNSIKIYYKLPLPKNKNKSYNLSTTYTFDLNNINSIVKPSDCYINNLELIKYDDDFIANFEFERDVNNLKVYKFESDEDNIYINFNMANKSNLKKFEINKIYKSDRSKFCYKLTSLYPSYGTDIEEINNIQKLGYCNTKDFCNKICFEQENPYNYIGINKDSCKCINSQQLQQSQQSDTLTKKENISPDSNCFDNNLTKKINNLDSFPIYYDRNMYEIPDGSPSKFKEKIYENQILSDGIKPNISNYSNFFEYNTSNSNEKNVHTFDKLTSSGEGISDVVFKKLKLLKNSELNKCGKIESSEQQYYSIYPIEVPKNDTELPIKNTWLDKYKVQDDKEIKKINQNLITKLRNHAISNYRNSNNIIFQNINQKVKQFNLIFNKDVSIIDILIKIKDSSESIQEIKPENIFKINNESVKSKSDLNKFITNLFTITELDSTDNEIFINSVILKIKKDEKEEEEEEDEEEDKIYPVKLELFSGDDKPIEKIKIIKKNNKDSDDIIENLVPNEILNENININTYGLSKFPRKKVKLTKDNSDHYCYYINNTPNTYKYKCDKIGDKSDDPSGIQYWNQNLTEENIKNMAILDINNTGVNEVCECFDVDLTKKLVKLRIRQQDDDKYSRQIDLNQIKEGLNNCNDLMKNENLLKTYLSGNKISYCFDKYGHLDNNNRYVINAGYQKKVGAKNILILFKNIKIQNKNQVIFCEIEYIENSTIKYNKICLVTEKTYPGVNFGDDDMRIDGIIQINSSEIYIFKNSNETTHCIKYNINKNKVVCEKNKNGVLIKYPQLFWMEFNHQIGDKNIIGGFIESNTIYFFYEIGYFRYNKRNNNNISYFINLNDSASEFKNQNNKKKLKSVFKYNKLIYMIDEDNNMKIYESKGYKNFQIVESNTSVKIKFNNIWDLSSLTFNYGCEIPEDTSSDSLCKDDANDKSNKEKLIQNELTEITNNYKESLSRYEDYLLNLNSNKNKLKLYKKNIETANISQLNDIDKKVNNINKIINEIKLNIKLEKFKIDNYKNQLILLPKEAKKMGISLDKSNAQLKKFEEDLKKLNELEKSKLEFDSSILQEKLNKINKCRINKKLDTKSDDTILQYFMSKFT